MSMIINNEIGRLGAYGSNAPTTGHIPMHDTATGESTYLTASEIVGGASGVPVSGTTGTFTTSVTTPKYINSATIATASTSVTLTTYLPILVGSTSAAKDYTLPPPGSDVGVYKYIRAGGATTSATATITVSSGNIIGGTIITLHNTGDAVTLYGETSTRWGIAGSYVAGSTAITIS